MGYHVRPSITDAPSPSSAKVADRTCARMAWVCGPAMGGAGPSQTPPGVGPALDAVFRLRFMERPSCTCRSRECPQKEKIVQRGARVPKGTMNAVERRGV